jgi:glycosyltransferase involved in cell wall biosynthesis
MPENAKSRLWRWLPRFSGKLHDDLLDRASIAEIRHRATTTERQAARDGDGGAHDAIHGLFLYHEVNAAIDRHYERLVAETEGLITWHRLYNPNLAATPISDLCYEHPSLTMPWRFAKMLEGGSIHGGFLDLAIIPSLIAANAPFVWLMEYDVDFAGHWSEFFRKFSNNRADFLTTMLASYHESRDWFHWPETQAPHHIHPLRRFRCFNPIMRLSRRFALAYVEALRDPGWRGHYEFALPTIAADAGFSMEDIGGHSRLCPPLRRGTNYTAPAGQHLTGPGTFVWRPIIPTLYTEQPDRFSQKGFLYHPCKIGVSDWTEATAAEHADRSAPPQRVAVIMCTFNGARHLHAQLQSLAGQTRAPDELIVGDDSSTDETVAILRAFAQTAPFPVKIVVQTSRVGFAANFMATANLTTCDLIFFCDQDDIWHERKIEIVANAARATAALAYCHDLAIVDDRRTAKAVSIPSYFDYLRALDLDPGLCCKGCALAVRADLLRILQRPLQSGISHDAWISLLTTALEQRLAIDVPLVRHRIHDNNASGWIISAKEARQRVNASAAGAFASMLDFYLHAWPPDWIDLLRDGLRTAGVHLDAVRAQAALRTLQNWQSSAAEMSEGTPAARHEMTVARALDHSYYRTRYPELNDAGDPVRHYLDAGWREGRNPTPDFSTNFYLSEYRDVAEAGLNPFLHYLLHGRSEGRHPNAASKLAAQHFAMADSSIKRERDHTDFIGVVAMVKNEANIIEAFVSHLLALFDKVVVIDHGSTDGTFEFLENISRIGEGLTVLRVEEPAYIQAQVMNHVLRFHSQLRALDWLFFLDADEFLPFESQASLKQEIKKYRHSPIIGMNWCNLVPTDYNRGPASYPMPGRFFIPPTGSPFQKVAIQPALLDLDSVWLSPGNHSLHARIDGPVLHSEQTDFQLLHIPIRSRSQILQKLDQGVKALNAYVNTPKGLGGRHWHLMHDYLQRAEFSDELLNAIIATYGEEIEFGLTYTHADLIEMGYQEQQVQPGQLDLNCKMQHDNSTDLPGPPQVSSFVGTLSIAALMTDQFGNITIDLEKNQLMESGELSALNG